MREEMHRLLAWRLVAFSFALVDSAYAFASIKALPDFRNKPCRPSLPGLSRISLFMAMKVNIRIVGRKAGSEKWLEEACLMYETRLRPYNLEVETTWHKDNEALIRGVETDRSKGHSVVLLDPLGKVRSSEQLSEDIYKWLHQGGSRLSFVIGGAEGLPVELKEGLHGASPPNQLSLSALTFTHQFARLLLMEQIYRASEIRKGSGYHK